MEIITGVERRRRWRPEQKLRILAELDEPDATVSEVARRHEVSRGLLWQWRDAQRRGELMDQPAFLPMRVFAAPDAPAAPPPGDAAAGPDLEWPPSNRTHGLVDGLLPNELTR